MPAVQEKRFSDQRVEMFHAAYPIAGTVLLVSTCEDARARFYYVNGDGTIGDMAKETAHRHYRTGVFGTGYSIGDEPFLVFTGPAQRAGDPTLFVCRVSHTGKVIETVFEEHHPAWEAGNFHANFALDGQIYLVFSSPGLARIHRIYDGRISDASRRTPAND